MKTYIAKPFEAIQINSQNIKRAIEVLPENFVFYGLNTNNGALQKEYDDDLEQYSKVGGYFYFNKNTHKIYNGDWVIKRKDRYEIVNDDYFKANFIEIPIGLFNQ
jgi:hypothetical protein